MLKMLTMLKLLCGQEEMSYSSTLKAELRKLEELSQKSGDQTVEELRAVRQMFEQSEESRNTSQFSLFLISWVLYIILESSYH